MERTRREVDDRVRELLAPLLDARPSPLQWRLVGWDAEQGISLTLERGDRVLLIELEARDDERDCHARTARFNVCARLAFREGEPLGDGERRAVEQLVAMVRSREGRLPEPPRAAAASGSEVREIEVDRLLIPEGNGHYYLNPYVGCMIGCAFCYAAERVDLSRGLEGLAPRPWGRFVDVKINAADVLRREVRAHRPGIVRISPIITDPYQPLERRYAITRQCLEVLRDGGFTPVILTRAALVLRDLDLLASFPVAAVGFSVPTDDDRVRAQFEPGADPIAARIDALARCHAAGLRTFAAIQPALPMDPARLVAQIAPLVRAVRIDRMYALPRALPLYEAAGCPEAATPEFFAATASVLREGFAARGVTLDGPDDLAGALGLTGPR